MAKMDYNSSSFRNAAIDKMNTRFGNGTPEKKSMTSQSASLANPFTNTKNPLKQPLTNTSIDRPKAPKPVSAGSKPETKPTTPAAKPAAPDAASTAPKTRKEVRKEVGAKVAAAKGAQKLAKVEAKGTKSAEDKMELREKRAANFGKAVKTGLEVTGTALGLYGTYSGIKKANSSNSQDGN
jgi:hypothetical protein